MGLNEELKITGKSLPIAYRSLQYFTVAKGRGVRFAGSQGFVAKSVEVDILKSRAETQGRRGKAFFPDS